MRLTPKKTCQQIIESQNHYLGALKGNQSGLFDEVQANFQVEDTYRESSQGHGRVEERIVSICRTLEGIRSWAGLCTLIRVSATRTLLKGEYEIVGKTETRYYISSLSETAQQFATRIRAYWGVENKVHYVRDVTQGEDASRIRVVPLPQLWAVARNLALNLYRDLGFDNMAQAQRRCGFSLNHLKSIFRMK
ncbi:ISAs1 family transposase [Coleofasciculus sp. H7-2]|uniref:ISAs1 family transposase n=1 Tax=Coleofasciculus sp. H7-2 TaxID=3351545 RepID=UPI00366B148F